MWRMSSSYKVSKTPDRTGGIEVDVEGVEDKCARLAGGRCTGDSDLLAMGD